MLLPVLQKNFAKGLTFPQKSAIIYPFQKNSEVWRNW